MSAIIFNIFFIMTHVFVVASEMSTNPNVNYSKYEKYPKKTKCIMYNNALSLFSILPKVFSTNFISLIFLLHFLISLSTIFFTTLTIARIPDKFFIT